MSVQAAAPLTSEIVERLEGRRIEALLAADGEALAELQHQHGVVVHSSGFVDAMASYAANLSASSFAYFALEVTDRRIEVVGDSAVVVYRQDADMLVRGDRHVTAARCCAVWCIEDGRIGLALVQSTRLAS